MPYKVTRSGTLPEPQDNFTAHREKSNDDATKNIHASKYHMWG